MKLRKSPRWQSCNSNPAPIPPDTFRLSPCELRRRRALLQTPAPVTPDDRRVLPNNTTHSANEPTPTTNNTLPTLQTVKHRSRKQSKDQAFLRKEDPLVAPEGVGGEHPRVCEARHLVILVPRKEKPRQHGQTERLRQQASHGNHLRGARGWGRQGSGALLDIVLSLYWGWTTRKIEETHRTRSSRATPRNTSRSPRCRQVGTDENSAPHAAYPPLPKVPRFSLTGSCTYSAQIIATRTSTGIAANHRLPNTTSRPMKPLRTGFGSASKVLMDPKRKMAKRARRTSTKKYAGAESSECDLA